MFFLLINYLHFLLLTLTHSFLLLSYTYVVVILHGQRYREGITKMQESSHSFDHHNQQPSKPKRRAVATAAAGVGVDQVLKDSKAAATATATATGSKEIILWAPDSIKLPEIRHFKKSARTIRRPIKGLHSTYHVICLFLFLFHFLFIFLFLSI